MSSKDEQKSREEVIAAREAKKLAKQNAKTKVSKEKIDSDKIKNPINTQKNKIVYAPNVKEDLLKSKDEVDKAVVAQTDIIKEDQEKSKDQVKADRAAKKLAKQIKKKGSSDPSGGDTSKELKNENIKETLSEIVEVAKEMQEMAIKPQEEGRSKSELKAERRAKQEAQRAAKAAQQAVVTKKPDIKSSVKSAPSKSPVKKEEKPMKKPLEKAKSKSVIAHKMNWFQHLYTEQDEDPLKRIPLNSNLHPAIIKLGVQLATRVVKGSNARCIALLDALKKMVTDYSLPAKTEFARGLEAHLSSSLDYLWSMRQPSASQTNAVKYFRYHLTQLSNNVTEFDAKKLLHEEIDRYIREQIEMAGEAISIAVRNKISNGDLILTYGCSSLIERILSDAVSAGVKFRCVVVGSRVHDAREMMRRLLEKGVDCVYRDMTAIAHVMGKVNKVILGASSLLANGSVLGALGTAQTALLARASNVPVLVCVETHKVSPRSHTDAFVYNELGNPDDLIDKSDENSPIKDWRSNPNLSLLNLTYDITPPSLVTAVVTELAILPCTSAPVVLRFKLLEYGV